MSTANFCIILKYELNFILLMKKYRNDNLTHRKNINIINASCFVNYLREKRKFCKFMKKKLLIDDEMIINSLNCSF